MPIIEVKDVSLGYEGRPILEHVSFTVESGDYLCILGENGSGKTTLMKTLLGLTPPLKGEIIAGDGFERSEIGYLPQQTVVQKDFPATVWEIVLSGCQSLSPWYRPFYTAREKKLAEKNLERMGITGLRNQCYRDLSGGQQQRVLLARALCAATRVLLLDEPVSGLDPVVTADMYELIRRLNEEGITILMISHDVSAVQYANRILHIGDQVFFGTKEEYVNGEHGRILTSLMGREK